MRPSAVEATKCNFATANCDAVSPVELPGFTTRYCRPDSSVRTEAAIAFVASQSSAADSLAERSALNASSAVFLASS